MVCSFCLLWLEYTIIATFVTIKVYTRLSLFAPLSSCMS